MRKFIQSRSAWEVMAVCLLAFFATVGIVMAATTIGTSITTEGNLAFDTASSTGAVSVHSLKVASTGSTVNGIRFGACASLGAQAYTAGTSTSVVCAASGVTSSDKVFVTPPNEYTAASANNWLIFAGASASSTAGYIDIQIFNASSTVNVTGLARTWAWMAIR